MAPEAKLYLHETWGYAEGSVKFVNTSFNSRAEMIPAVRLAYARAAKEINADGMIPSLEAMNMLYDEMGDKTYRDGYHCSLGLGRYTLGCLFFMILFERDVTGNTYRDFDVDISEDEILIAQKIARKTAVAHGVELK